MKRVVWYFEEGDIARFIYLCLKISSGISSVLKSVIRKDGLAGVYKGLGATLMVLLNGLIYI